MDNCKGCKSRTTLTRRCKFAKCNPATKMEADIIVSVFGWVTICRQNEYKQEALKNE